MSHPQLQKLDPHGLSQPRVDPCIIGCAKVVNLISELYRILAAGMDHITFRVLQKLKGFRVAPSAKPSGVLIRVNLRPAVRVRALAKVKFIAVAAGVKRAFNLHGWSSSGVHDVCCKFVGGYGINHGPSVRKFLGMGLGFRQSGKATASARPGAPANCGEHYSVFKAFCFVGVKVGHFFLHVFSNICLCDWLEVGSKKVMAPEKKEAA
jgi:hypothetical protein